MNEYIVLDGKKYATVGKNWQPSSAKPMTATPMADGSVSVTFGVRSLKSYTGEIIAPYVENRVGWGSSSDLETSLDKLDWIAFTDHLGTERNVVVAGWKRRSLINRWDSSANKFYYEVRLSLI